MGFKDTLNDMLQQRFLKKYGDRLTGLRGNIVSVKVTEKTFLFFIHNLRVDILLRPERSKNIARCYFKKRTFFKKFNMIHLQVGNLVLIQGIKEKNSETVEAMNIQNLTTKKSIIDVDQPKQKQQRKIIRK
ncbi:hypothetical protein OXPF_22180 [Oxobacter pfennigii]|uniref:Uncharacterized protein n=1 Tax=Oxobacter pfennigii TaxID=36849 RepID=A0A0P8W5T4_9CLOT|nr:hypothetical protein [Oxobacter pfennigii]KPU44052.1 hypothetical protein OXPF_22180 [Oxobacter pfennigii]